MGKSTVKIKHLGLVSTGKFLSVFCLIFSILMLGVWALVFGMFMLFSLVLGLGLGGRDALFGMVLASGFSLVTFLLMAVAFVVIYTVMGFVMGVIMAFVFNLVVKISGGLSLDAEIG
ncbi:MAG: hypothetical protein V1744_00265 [Candidatus Altiarchaeota archaeon]